VVVSAALFVLATPVFVIRQRRVQAPLVDLRLFDNWGRASAYLTNLVLAAIRLGAVLLIGLYLQGTGTGGSSVAGLVVSSVAVGIVVTSPVSGWLTGRLPAQIVCTAGMAMTAVALGFLGLGLEPSTRPIVLAVVLFCLGVGAGLFMTPNTASIMTSVPADRRGIANAVRSTCQNTGYTLSTAVLLGVATYPLSTVERRLAYRGELSTLGPHAVSQFTAAMHLAFCGLAVLALVAALVSYSRGDRLTAAASMAVR
jgi:MFS family permease